LACLTIPAARAGGEQSLAEGQQDLGRLRGIEIRDGEVVLGPPCVFDAKSIEEFRFETPGWAGGAPIPGGGELTGKRNRSGASNLPVGSVNPGAQPGSRRPGLAGGQVGNPGGCSIGGQAVPSGSGPGMSGADDLPEFDRRDGFSREGAGGQRRGAWGGG